MPQLLYSSDTHFLKLDTTTLKHLINDAPCGAECEVVAAIIGALYIS
jgi:MinD superfamily P-loop ATPase